MSGIIFTGLMVQKLLAGKKTQTRRLIKPQPEPIPDDVPRVRGEGQRVWWPSSRARSMVSLCDMPSCSPYGTRGARLWVREQWRTMEHPRTRTDGIVFAADGEFVPIENTAAAADNWVVAHDNGKYGTSYRSPIYMPRWAARITLELVEVRVERLQAITEDDITAEGLGPIAYDKVADHPWALQTEQRSEFARGWNEINGKRKGGSWDANPWVWVLGFRVLPRASSVRTPTIIPHPTTCTCPQCERSHDL